MPERAAVAVIMPAFNVGDYVANALDSVRARAARATALCQLGLALLHNRSLTVRSGLTRVRRSWKAGEGR